MLPFLFQFFETVKIEGRKEENHIQGECKWGLKNEEQDCYTRAYKTETIGGVTYR